jgi:hypothetical protein
MKTRLIATLSALSLSAFAGVSARAEDVGTALAWQQPGYVMEVVVATAPRPTPVVRAVPTLDGTLAWQEPGYVEEVVVVKASRSEVLAAAGWPEFPILNGARPAWLQPFLGAPTN